MVKWNERTPHHSIKHDGLRLMKCINLTAKHNWITKCSKYAQNYISDVWYYFHKIRITYFLIFAVRSCGSSFLAFVAGFYGSCTLMIVHFAVRSYRSWIFKICSLLRSWGSWSYGSWILNFCFIVGSWRSWILIYFCFAVGSTRSWTLHFCFVARFWRYWILT